LADHEGLAPFDLGELLIINVYFATAEASYPRNFHIMALRLSLVEVLDLIIFLSSSNLIFAQFYFAEAGLLLRLIEAIE
jgi:hypothetical protein